ncbi:MAG: DJ-1/PfpI family protein [Alphaproteobacteria bacterium]|nr:DJ-1/PfpI family protein [Alphaproteobacteria bacterium]
MTDLTRRGAGRALTSAALLFASGAAAPDAATAAIEPPPAHDMTGLPAEWHGSERIVFLIYPGFTALDMVGPHYMLTNLMGATTKIVAASRAPVKSDTGLAFVPDATFEDITDAPDIFCVPGGTSGTLAAIEDVATLRFVKHIGGAAKIVTSVCTGSLILGAAGLLDGYRATSHWVTRPLLPIFGAIPTEGRVVRDRNRITGGGVTAGIDFGLSLVGQLRDRTYAESVQLLAEYAPEPPFDSGTPGRAAPGVKGMMEAMFVDFLRQAEQVGRDGVARAAGL